MQTIRRPHERPGKTGLQNRQWCWRKLQRPQHKLYFRPLPLLKRLNPLQRKCFRQWLAFPREVQSTTMVFVEMYQTLRFKVPQLQLDLLSPPILHSM